MSTYLLAWAVGEFDFVQGYSSSGVSIRVFCPPGRAPQGYFALDAAQRALEFYNDFFSVKYPLPKLDMLCVTEFAAGAMENWGLVTYREVDLMIDPEKASSQQKQRVAIVVAHELAHQWFGNLVTMEWWDGIWLNEGFAAFMEHFCVDALYPEYKIWEQYTIDAFGAAQRLDSLRTSHPVIVPIKAAEEVDQVFDAISYCKGSTCVRAVKHVIGIDAFRNGLQTYFQKYQYSNASTDQLWAEWTAASGVDVASLMDTWTKTKGHPYVKFYLRSGLGNRLSSNSSKTGFSPMARPRTKRCLCGEFLCSLLQKMVSTRQTNLRL
jgi:aminopeptidase N